MLDFFRKHQRIFFVFIAIVTVVSFSFFGTYQAMNFGSSHEVRDREIGKAIDGSSVSEQEVKAFARFISSGLEDFSEARKEGVPNLSSGSIVYKDFIKTGLAEMLAGAYFEELKGDLEERLKRVRLYRPYSHPQVPFLSAAGVWQHFIPELSEHLLALKEKSAKPSLEVFSLLCQLYADQAAFPADQMKHILLSQKQQFSWISQDPQLQEGSLSLFGFQSVEQWFGPRFLELTGQFILNASILAEQKGYRVSKDEAYANLLQNTVLGMRTLSNKNDITFEQASTYMQHELRSLGIDDIQAIEMWRKVLLFRRLFEEEGESVFLDSLASLF